MLTLAIYIPYKSYAKILKWLCLSLLAYPITVFIVSENWWLVLKATFIPNFEWSYNFLFMLLAILGTTISPYLFFWQASQEVEEVQQGQTVNKHYIRNLRIDNFTGMFFSEVATWAIIVVAGTVLFSHGITNINTAADAAKALEPLVQNFPNAGLLAKIIFAIGIIGLGLISVPVLAASAAYALCEAFNHTKGLSLKLKEARFFYGIIMASMFVGLSLNFIGIDPIKALIYAAVINGVIAVPLIFVIGLIAQNKKIMGKYASGKLSQTLVTLTFLAMFLSTLGLLFTL
jgi:Mn2+/Fe2+ NRAMP family transporter